MEKFLGQPFLVLSNSADVRQKLSRAQKVFRLLLWVIKNNFIEPMRSLETNFPEKKRFFALTKAFGLSFLILSSVTKLGERFIGVQKLFW